MHDTELKIAKRYPYDTDMKISKRYAYEENGLKNKKETYAFCENCRKPLELEKKLKEEVEEYLENKSDEELTDPYYIFIFSNSCGIST